MTINQFQEKSTEISKTLFEESKNIKPSIYPLKRLGGELFEIVKIIQSKNETLILDLSSVETDLDIFLEDIDSKLESANKKDYRDRWTDKAKSLERFTERIKEYFRKETES